MADKSSKLFIAIGLLVVVAAAVVVYFLAIRPRGAPPAVTVAETPEAAPAAPAPTGAPAPAPAQQPAPAVAAKPAPAPPLEGSIEPYRADPFKNFARRFKGESRPLLARLNLPAPSLVRIAVGPGLRVVERPKRRVAGLLRDGRVWAIYESEKGRTSVVKPGDIVEEGMVQAITEESLLLTVPEATEPVVVPLARGAAAPARPPAAIRPGMVSGRAPTGVPRGPAYPVPPTAPQL